MKALSILPVSAAAMMAFGISTASSQGACQQEFQACMDSCATRSAKALQDRCFNSCESTNNVCAERVYGKRPFNGTSTTAAAQGQAKDALAKTEKAPAQTREQAADQEQAPAVAEKPPVAPQRGQARR